MIVTTLHQHMWELFYDTTCITCIDKLAPALPRNAYFSRSSNCLHEKKAVTDLWLICRRELIKLVMFPAGKTHSLWDDYLKGLKIESVLTLLIIRFFGIKTKINILPKNLGGVTFVKIIRKRWTGVKCFAITEYYILYHCLTNITDISTYEVSIPGMGSNTQGRIQIQIRSPKKYQIQIQICELENIQIQIQIHWFKYKYNTLI